MEQQVVSPMRWRAGENRAGRVWLRRRARTQHGMTMVETLLAVAIVSILLLGIMAAITTTVNVSRSTGQVAATRNALATVVERVSAAGWPGCKDAQGVKAALDSEVIAPTGYVFSVERVSSAFPERTACTGSPESTALKLQIKVSHTQTNDSATGEVVVRNKSARPT